MGLGRQEPGSNSGPQGSKHVHFPAGLGLLINSYIGYIIFIIYGRERLREFGDVGEYRYFGQGTSVSGEQGLAGKTMVAGGLSGWQ